LLLLSFLLRQRQATSFTDLRRELALTDGTLSVHLSKLETGGLVSVEKRIVGKRPQTLVDVTAEGRRQFKRYVAELKTIVPGLADR
jgi:DNA-binding MarR family transcriptional regulator